METTENTPEQEIDPELAAALNMPDDEYINELEQYIVALSETNKFGHEAIQTFVELLEFIGENFGETSDFPIRIDTDFYKDLFLVKLNNCNEKIQEFLDAHGCSEDLDEDDEDDEDEGDNKKVF